LKKKPTRRQSPAQSGDAKILPRPATGRSEGKRSSLLERYRTPGLILLYVLLALNFVRLPKIAVNNTHDPGSHMAFEFYAKHHYQFGVDVVQNVGPYGYLSYPYDYSGILPTQKLMFGILFGLALAWFALEARRYFFSSAGKIIWFLGIFLALTPRYEELDPISELFVLLAGHQLLLHGRDRPGRFVSDAVLCVFLSLLALMKSTNVMLVSVLSVLIVVERVRSRQFLDLAWNIGCLGIATCLFWLLAGQKFSNVAAFMRGAAAFSKGYNEALSHAGYPEMVLLGLVPPALFAAVNILRVLKFQIYGHRLLTSVFEAACIFVVWKHGHVRSGHEGFYWAFVIPATPLLFLAHEKPLPEEKPSANAPSRKAASGLISRNFSIYRLGMVPVAVCCLCVIRASVIEETNPNFAYYANPWTAVADPAGRMGANLWELVDWPDHLNALKVSLEKNREEAALPKVKESVGNATIDMFGFLPGAILLNDLNYKPRPMPINFAATTQILMERNAEFYRNDATAPEYLLALIWQIDGRFPPQDDALAMPEVLEHYAPVLMDTNGFILLKRTPGAPDLQRMFLGSQTIGWGESVPLPQTGTNLLWCSADIHFSLLGKMRSTFFQPAQLFIVLQSASHRLGPVRLLQSGATTGFMLRPLIVNSVDFLTAYGLHNEKWTPLRTPSFDRVGFVISPDDQAFFEPKITVSFWSIGPKHD
jgi:hypothetical protein